MKKLIVILMAAAAMVAATGCSPKAESTENNGAGMPESIVVVNTGGDWGAAQREAYADTFTEATGINVIDSPFLDDGQIKAAVETGVYDADVVFPTPAMALETSGSKYLEPIDYSLVDKHELFPGTYTDYGVALGLYSWAFGYRTDAGPAPEKWEDFFDTAAYPGKRGLVSWDFATVIIGALLADGVSPEELVPLDVDRALAKLDTIKDDIVWFGTGSAGQDLLVSGEVRFVQLYSNRMVSSRNAGEPVDLIWDGQIVIADYLGIPKGSPNALAAQAYIAHAVSAKVNGRFTFLQPGAPSNMLSEVDPDVAADLPTSYMDGRHVVSSRPDIAGYVENNLQELTERFNAWKGDA